MIDPRDLRVDGAGPPTSERTDPGPRAGGGESSGPPRRAERGDDGPSRSAVTNQHSFADEDSEVDAARNYHGADDSA